MTFFQREDKKRALYMEDDKKIRKLINKTPHDEDLKQSRKVL